MAARPSCVAPNPCHRCLAVLGVALVQSVLLRHRLPLSIWPCSAVMLGGAAMVRTGDACLAASHGSAQLAARETLRAPLLRTAANQQPALPPSPSRPATHGQVIVPSIGSGSGAGLNDWRGWLGFGLSLASMAATVVYFVSLQASRRLGFTSLQLQVRCAGVLRCAAFCCAGTCGTLARAVLHSDWHAGPCTP